MTVGAGVAAAGAVAMTIGAGVAVGVAHPEGLAEQFLVQIRARDRTGALEVVRRRLAESLGDQVVAPDPVHLEVLLGRRQLVAPVAGEVGPARDVQLVVGDVRNARGHERAQVAQHVIDRLVRPPEDQVDAERQSQVAAGIDGVEDLRGVLAPPARLDQLVVELLHAHADPVDAGRLHRLQLLAGEGLRNPFEGHLDIGWDVEQFADDPHQRGVLIRPVEVGRPAAEVDAGKLGAAQPGAEQFSLAAEVVQVRVELLPVAVDLARKQAEPAAVRLRRQAVRRADVQVYLLPHRLRRGAAVRHHVADRDFAVEPEHGRRVPMEHLVALASPAVGVDPGTDIR